MRVDQALLDCLCEIARAAGREIMQVYAGPVEAWQKDDASPLTEADLRADAVIRSGLEKNFPGVFILSEESASVASETTDTFFLVDPLDGTKEFVRRNGEFTVNIACIREGIPVAGVVFAPALDELFYAGQSLGAWKCSAGGARPLLTGEIRKGGTLRVVGSRSHGGDKLAAWLATVEDEYTLATFGSSLKFCRIAENQADIYPRFGPTSQWDTAAAQCVLEQAGGCVLDLDGMPLLYGLQRPILNPEFVALGQGAHFDLLFPASRSPRGR